jgi:hypothetical protein
MANRTWYRLSCSGERVLKIVLRTLRARPVALFGEEVMGAETFWQSLGRKMSGLPDWCTRCTRRLYAATNSGSRVNGCMFSVRKERHTSLGSAVQCAAGSDNLLERIHLVAVLQQRRNL